MSKILRVGVIGTGFGARIQAPIFHSDNRFQVVALASVSGRYPRNNPEVQNVYTDWKSMIKQERPDLVSIASEPKLHYEMAKYAMEQGADVLCEKPMALDAEQSAHMLKLKDTSGRLGFIDFEWRFLPARVKVREIIRTGKLGTITHIRYQGNRDNLSTLRTKELGWHGDKDAGGGVLNAVGSHLFDSLLWWMGENISALSAQLSTYVPFPNGFEDGERRTSDQAFQVVGDFASGTTFSAEFISGQRNKMYEWRLEVFGSEGTLVMVDDREVHIALGDEAFHEVELANTEVAPTGLPDDAIRFYQPFSNLLDRIYKRVSNQEENGDNPRFEDGHKVQLVLDAVRLSHRERRTVPVVS